MQADRVRAPANDGEVLARPSIEESPHLLDENIRKFSAWDHDFQGRRFSRLRGLARAELLAKSRAYHDRVEIEFPDIPKADERFVVTGHQPELYHPGVWVKNFAVASIARASGSIGVNLIVDNDIPKGPLIRVPGRDASGFRSIAVPFDDWVGEVPYEDQVVRDSNLFHSFPDRVRDAYPDAPRDLLLDRFWPLAEGDVRGASHVGSRISRARRIIEHEWGADNIEVSLGSICEADAFLWFACHLLARADEFRAIHNEALTHYRAAYGIRSAHHPVPALDARDDWREAPFWVWRKNAPRRRPLLARQLGKTMQLRVSGELEPFVEIPLSLDREACCAVEVLRGLAARGIRVRSRALTTTMFARLFLGDLFVHGIGGAKYDELGDEILRRFLGVEPPRFLTLSMTLRVGLAEFGATPAGLRRVEHQLGDVSYNPERHLDDPVPKAAERLLLEKKRVLEEPAFGRRARMLKIAALRRVNAVIAGWATSARSEFERERDRVRRELDSDTTARSREFASILHSERRLRDSLTRATGLGVDSTTQRP